MRILVTGATGFAGPAVIAALTAQGHRVRAAVRRNRQPPCCAHDIVEAPGMAQAFDAAPLVAGVDAVVHLAGIAHASSSIPPDVYMAVNCEAARQLAAASREAGVRRFIYVSSVRAQCGPSVRGIVTESDAPAPTDAYGRSKLAGERAVAQALAGSATDHVIMRPVLMYGPRAKGNMAALMRLARSRWPLPLGGLTGRRSILSDDNFGSAVVHVLEAGERAGHTYLVADSKPLTAGEIVALLRAGLERSGAVLRLPLPGAATALRAAGKGDLAQRLFGDLVVSTQALTSTGWQPVESSAQGLARAIGRDGARCDSARRGVPSD